MQFSHSSPPFLATHPFCSKSVPLHPTSKQYCFNPEKRRGRAAIQISASKRDDYYHYEDHKLIDEEMIVLRMRIQEIKLAERNYVVSSEWMEWEKKYYCDCYSSDVCEAVGFLQSVLMKTRPSLALGIVGLVVLMVLTSTGSTVFHLVGFAKWLVCL